MMRKNLRKWKDDWMTRIVFMGTPDFSVPVLSTLIDDGYEVVGVVTQPDRPKGRKSDDPSACQGGSAAPRHSRAPA